MKRARSASAHNANVEALTESNDDLILLLAAGVMKTECAKTIQVVLLLKLQLMVAQVS